MKGDMNWTPIYLAIVAAIAVILITAVIKPMFQSAGDYATLSAIFSCF